MLDGRQPTLDLVRPHAVSSDTARVDASARRICVGLAKVRSLDASGRWYSNRDTRPLVDPPRRFEPTQEQDVSNERCYMYVGHKEAQVASSDAAEARMLPLSTTLPLPLHVTRTTWSRVPGGATLEQHAGVVQPTWDERRRLVRIIGAGDGVELDHPDPDFSQNLPTTTSSTGVESAIHQTGRARIEEGWDLQGLDQGDSLGSRESQSDQWSIITTLASVLLVLLARGPETVWVERWHNPGV
ncbi:hypothetical protein LTR53_000340 [Teratosphaeriaceae sp. CCFEE 6253]|nr:hypothetical protein LTR53_000340 [Teratosphaeriaceae sp. CCFEE 6253]